MHVSQGSTHSRPTGCAPARVGVSVPVARRILAVLAFMSLAVTACDTGAGPAPKTGDHVSMLVTWTGAERVTFDAVLARFQSRTGITVDVETTSDLAGELSQRVANGHPPDVSGLVGPGQMVALARAGALRDLGDAIDLATYGSQTAPAFVELGTVDGRLVGAFAKATLKGLVWFDPRTNRLGVPADWVDLERSAWRAASGPTFPWCVGLESGAASGWPGTDWVENALLRQSGTRVYDDWVAGTLPWTSPEVRAAFELYGSVVQPGSVWGGTAGAISTSFDAAGAPLFTDPSGCLYLMAASFMPAMFEAAGMRPAIDYDFFPFPDIEPQHAGTVEVAGDLLGLFSDRPAARQLMAYLVGADAQAIWVERGGALSANTQVTDYPDVITRREAAVLIGASRVRFDASDQMPPALNAAFWRGVLRYTEDQSSLDDVLAGLEAVRTGASGS